MINAYYPLAMTDSLRTWKWPMEIVDLPFKVILRFFGSFSLPEGNVQYNDDIMKL